jgi:flagellum-specific ATP synthase
MSFSLHLHFIQSANKTREALSRYRESEDLITIGAYQKGSNSLLDQSIRYYERMIPFLQQGINENVPYVESVERLHEIIQ